METDKELANMYQIVKSVQGVGKITAWAILITTAGFTKFENPKQFACYAGVAPFENSSGKLK